jgi:hypothetical protein
MDEDEVPIEDLHAALLAGETTAVNAGPNPSSSRRIRNSYSLGLTGGAAVPLVT